LKSLLIILSIVFISLSGFSQDGYIKIHKEYRVDQIVELYSRYHNSVKEKKGYRVQILATTMRDKAYQTEKSFKANYTEKTYLTFKSPYFKLRVGDFPDYLSAFRFLQEIKSKYTESFLVFETILTE
jgi:hypothetical protein